MPRIFSTPKIVACYSVYNEAALIRSSLDSVKHYVDEVFVADGAYRLDKLSDDETYDIIDDCLTGMDDDIGRLWLNKPNLTEIEKRNILYSGVPGGNWIFIIDGDEICVGDVKRGLEKVRASEFPICEVQVFNNGRPWMWFPRFFRSRRDFHLKGNHWTYKYGGEVVWEGAGVKVPTLRINDFVIINCNVLRPANRLWHDTIYKAFMSARQWNENSREPLEVQA